MQHKTSRAFKFSVRRELIIAAALVLIAMLLVFFGPHIRTDQAFISSEVQFADTSAQGLSIVPASCPSDPHWDGECDGVPPPPGFCHIEAAEPSVPSGQSTALSWSIYPGNPERPACPLFTKCSGALQSFEIRDVLPNNTLIYSGTVENIRGTVTVTPQTDYTDYMLTATYEGYGWNSEPVAVMCQEQVRTGDLCGLVAEKHTIQAGESTNLLWSTTDRWASMLPAWYYNNKLEMDNGIGVIFDGKGNQQGAIAVSPSQTTTYTLTARTCFTTTGACGDPQFCRTTVTVGGGSTKYACNSNNQCVLQDGGPYTSSNCNNECSGGQKYSCNQNNQCVSDPNGQYTSSNCNNACAPQTKFSCSNNQCVSNPNGPYTSYSSCASECGGGGGVKFSCNSSNQCLLDPYGPYSTSNCNEGCGKCPEGQVWVPDPDDKFGGKCEPIECPPGTILQGNRCVPISCPSGQILGDDGKCHCPANNPHCNQCTERYYCAGDNLRHIDTQCVDSFVRQCYAGCTVNGCLSFPPPDADFTVKPGLVRRSDLTNVAWNARNVSLCTVRGTNNDGSGQNATGVWNTISGTKMSSPILGKTTYTLTCTGKDGSTLKKSLDVNIIPDWVEI